MKKIIYFLLTMMFMISIFFTYFITSNLLQSNFLFNHYHILEVDIDTSDPVLFDEIVHQLQMFSIENEINISRYLFRGFNVLDIYSTNVREDPNIKLRSGIFPEGANYITNQPLREENYRKVGQFYFPGLNFEVRLFDFEQIHQVGLADQLFLTGSEEVVAMFIDEFSHYGQIVLLESFLYEPSGILSLFPVLAFSHNMQMNLISMQLRIMFVFMFVSLIMIFYYINQSRKQFFLEELWGRSSIQAVLIIFKDFVHFFIGLMICLFGGLIIFTLIFHQEHFFSIYLLALVLSTTIMFLLLLLIALIGSFFAKKTNEIGSNIKGKSLFWQIKGGAFLVKTSVYLLLWLGIASSFSAYQMLEQELSEFGNWEQAQDIFRTPLSRGRLSVLHDLRAMRELNNRLFRFYQQMVQDHDAFTIHPHQIIHVDGVIINENYLDINPIRGLNGSEVREQMIQDRYTLNLLVPEQFKYLENEIIEAYQNEFYFQKVFITNMFNEEVGEPLIEGITLDDLTVNIIYTEEGQNYFSFNKFHGGESNTFYDPIAMILPTESVDTSFVAALVTTSLYFYDSSGQAYETILPAITESEMVEINSAISVYDEANQEIIFMQQQLFYQLVEVILIITFSLLIFSLFIWAYYQTNSYQLNLKYLFGYSFWERHQTLIFVALFSNLIAGRLVVSILEVNPSAVWWFIGVFFLIDLVLIKILSHSLSKKSIVRVLKGGTL